MRRIRFGLLFKLFLSFFLLFVAAVLLLSVFLIGLERFRVELDLRMRGEILARNLAYNSEYSILANNIEYLDRLVENLMEERSVLYVQILDARGRVLSRNEKARFAPPVYNLEYPVKATAIGRPKEKIVGNIKMGISLRSAVDITRQLMSVILGITFSIVLLGSFGIYILGKYLLIIPLRQFSAVTHGVAKGDLSQKVRIQSADEIGELAAAFNLMTESLRKSRKEIEGYTRTLELKVEERTRELTGTVRKLEAATADLEKAKTGLEEQVMERTEELRQEKEGLAQRVAERTVSLEKSRKAILHMMKDLKEDMEKMKVVDKMKNEFLSVISHELRTPLTPIKGYASLLLAEQGGSLNPSQRRAVDIIRKEGEHLLDLIDGLLDVSRMVYGRHLELKKEPVSLKAMVDEIVEAMRPQYETLNVDVKNALPEDFPALMIDPAKVRRVLVNLLGNAFKFTPSGGRVEVAGVVMDDSVEVQVIDNGIGIDRENLAKVFEKFYQVDSSYTRAAGGVGLGLAIAKEIIETHGGKIWVESEGLGKGSKFCFTLLLGG